MNLFQRLENQFSRIARWISDQFGKSHTFVIAATLVLVWIITGPLFDFSDGWQLVINTSTTIITFLAVFLLQHTQLRDMLAIQVKLDELIRTSNASNNAIGVEDLTEDELRQVRTEILDCVEHLRGRHARPPEAATARQRAWIQDNR